MIPRHAIASLITLVWPLLLGACAGGETHWGGGDGHADDTYFEGGPTDPDVDIWSELGPCEDGVTSPPSDPNVIGPECPLPDPCPTPCGCGAWTQLAVGLGHACALREDGFVDCWGEASARQTHAPEGPFTQVSVGFGHTCGVRVDGAVECWGADSFGAAQPPQGAFQAVAAGVMHTCGIRSNGQVACWGIDMGCEPPAAGQEPASVEPPPGAFAALATSDAVTCGIRVDGSLACWGRDAADDVLPSGPFSALAIHDPGQCPGDPATRGCAIRTADQGLSCWGGAEVDAPDGAFASVAVLHYGAYAVDTAGVMHAWGTFEAPPPGAFRAVWGSGASGGAMGACALTADGEIRCWGFPGSARVSPRGPIAQVEDGCLLTASGEVVQWGNPGMPYGVREPRLPEGPYAEVGCEAYTRCGLRHDGGIVCVKGIPADEASPTAPWIEAPGPFTAVEAGYDFACGLRVDGELECWGGAPGLALPGGPFVDLSVSDRFGCGLRADASVACWGDARVHGDGDPAPDPPQGEYDRIATAFQRACATTLDGGLVCWIGTRLVSTELQGAVDSLTVGEDHVCGLRSDGSLACAGTRRVSHCSASPAPVACGPFAALGERCVVYPDGSAGCWTDDSFFHAGIGRLSGRPAGCPPASDEGP